MRTPVLLTLALLAAPRAATPQDFAAPGAPLGGTPSSFLERALPPSGGGIRFESNGIRWFGLTELSTASAALGASWRGGRVALGLSRTGEADLGWSALALAAGWADRRSGAAARLLGRRMTSASSGGGVETGAGAWAEAATGVRLWASAPQLWTHGAAPPLSRRLEIGVALRTGEIEAWASRASSPGAPQGLRGEHAAGVAARMEAAALWAELRDRPARAAFGLSLAWKGTVVACQVDGHPVLGDTWKLGLAMGAAR
jgi:hypothetical protein